MHGTPLDETYGFRQKTTFVLRFLVIDVKCQSKKFENDLNFERFGLLLLDVTRIFDIKSARTRVFAIALASFREQRFLKITFGSFLSLSKNIFFSRSPRQHFSFNIFY